MTQPDTNKVREFLTQHHVGVLATVSEDGTPWGSAITFTVDDSLNFFFMTRKNTLKYKNIAADPHVALTVTDEAHQITVQAIGIVEPVASEDIMEVVFDKLDKAKPAGKSHWIAPVYKVHQGDYMILQFRPTKLQYADFSDAQSDLHTDYIEQII